MGTLVYWVALHSTVKEELAGNTIGLIHMYLVHSLPTVCLLLVYFSTERLLIRSSHWRVVLPVTLLYSLVNYRETRARGKPLYWFLTWQDWQTPAILTVIIAFVVLLWQAMAHLTMTGKGGEILLININSEGLKVEDKITVDNLSTESNSQSRTKEL